MNDDLAFRQKAAGKVIQAIAAEPDGVTLDTWVPGALDLGRECRVGEGLQLGSDLQEDVRESPLVRKVFAKLDLELPKSGLLGDCCKALMMELQKR